MANDRSQELLTFAHLQMASEAFLNGFNTDTPRQELIDALGLGNERASRFPPVLAEEFADTFEVIAHRENTSTGFSGTLFRSISNRGISNRGQTPNIHLGSDILRGQAGDDQYVLSAGDQNDYIDDREGVNTIRLGAAVSQVFQSIDSDSNTYLGLRYGSDTVYVRDGLTNASMHYELPDGTVRTAADWRSSFGSFVGKVREAWRGSIAPRS